MVVRMMSNERTATNRDRLFTEDMILTQFVFILISPSSESNFMSTRCLELTSKTCRNQDLLADITFQIEIKALFIDFNHKEKFINGS